MSKYNLANNKSAFVDPKTGSLTKYGLDILRAFESELGLPSSSTITTLELGELYDPGIESGELISLHKRVNQLEKELEMYRSFDPTDLLRRLSALEKEIEMYLSFDPIELMRRLRALENEQL